MLTIVALVDTHGHHADVAVPDGDVLVLAGDLTRRGTLPELAQALDHYRRLPHAHKLVIAGNHEFCLQKTPEQALPLLHGFTYLLDSGVTLHGLRFWGSPWQPYFYNWAFNLHRGPKIAEKWAKIPEDTDVLVTHGPPRGHGDDVGHDRVGCEDLLARVRVVRPLLHLYGHIHEDRGHWRLGDSLLVNATTDEGLKPATVIHLDPTTRRAEIAGP
jgi:Icc-related predicted phosphoesterase